MSACHLAHILFALAGRDQVADDIAVVFFAYKFGDIPGTCFTFLICNTVLTKMYVKATKGTLPSAFVIP